MSFSAGNGTNGARRQQLVKEAALPETAVSARTPPPVELTDGCPYFGSIDDPATRFLFASPAGACHRAEPPDPVALGHQQTCCLTAQHTACPVFRRAETGPLPADLRAEPANGRAWSKKTAWAAAGLLVVLVLAAAVWLFAGAGGSRRSLAAQPAGILAAAATATPTMAATNTSSPVAEVVVAASSTAFPATATATATSMPTSTATLLPTITPSPTAVPSATLPATFTPSAAISPTLLPTAVPLVIVDVPTLNVRQGPGTAYSILAAVEQGGQYEVVGQSFNGEWWQLCCFLGEPGWVIGEAVTITGDTANVPVVSVAPATLEE
ncbi:MAG: hypothetical protein H6659_16110 [Ardenticatenaceae bacterium]|nr:hypothetical protein [Ardenticatenaceae bacterium]MCB8988124.1 hypothetical protein [Ardenticatenaceae bacterium]